MKALCDKLGGILTVLLSLGLMTATVFLIHSGRCDATLGLGFIAATLLPLALGNHHHRRCQQLADQLTAANNGIRSGIAAHAGDVRQHASRQTDELLKRIDVKCEAVNEVSRQTTAALANKIDALKPAARKTKCER